MADWDAQRSLGVDAVTMYLPSQYELGTLSSMKTCAQFCLGFVSSASSSSSHDGHD